MYKCCRQFLYTVNWGEKLLFWKGVSFTHTAGLVSSLIPVVQDSSGTAPSRRARNVPKPVPVKCCRRSLLSLQLQNKSRTSTSAPVLVFTKAGMIFSHQNVKLPRLLKWVPNVPDTEGNRNFADSCDLLVWDINKTNKTKTKRTGLTHSQTFL